jgi:hypothetical protein
VKLVAGQRVRLSGKVFSAAGDRRMDRVAWQTDNAKIATVDASGLVTAVGTGTTTINASAGAAVRRLPIQVVAGSIASLSVDPAVTQARTGDVLRFSVTAKDASGKRSPASHPRGASRRVTARSIPTARSSAMKPANTPSSHHLARAASKWR